MATNVFLVGVVRTSDNAILASYGKDGYTAMVLKEVRAKI